MAWILVPCLVQLRTEFNRVAPDRDKASDGSIGDTAHAASSSDHNPDETGTVPIHDADSTNEVHAIDVDKDLREPDLSMEEVVQFLLGRCRSGSERRLRYIIFNRRIWSASSDWAQQAYTGASPHTEHAHFSASYDTAREASTASWHLEDLVALSAEDLDKIEERLLKITKQADTDFNQNPIGRAVLDFQAVPNPIAGGKTTLYKLLGDIAGQAKAANTALASLASAVNALDVVDEQDRAQIAATILAGLPQNLAERVAQETIDAMGNRLSGGPAAPPAGG